MKGGETTNAYCRGCRCWHPKEQIRTVQTLLGKRRRCKTCACVEGDIYKRMNESNQQTKGA